MAACSNDMEIKEIRQTSEDMDGQQWGKGMVGRTTLSVKSCNKSEGGKSETITSEKINSQP